MTVEHDAGTLQVQYWWKCMRVEIIVDTKLILRRECSQTGAQLCVDLMKVCRRDGRSFESCKECGNRLNDFDQEEKRNRGLGRI